MKALDRLLISLCVLLAFEACAGAHEKPWLEATTPNFQVHSMANPEATQEIAVELEQLRHAVSLVTRIEFEDPPIPTHVLVLDHATFRTFSRHRDVVGLFRQGTRANWIAMTESRTREARITIQHEYIHYLLHSHEGFNYPRWYDEGFACFLSTLQTVPGKVIVGSPALESLMLGSGSWIPIPRLIEADTGLPISQFYAESWLLVHYLLWDREERRNNAVTSYVQSIERGTKPGAAFEQAFGLTPEQADREVSMLAQSLRSGADPDRALHVIALDSEDESPDSAVKHATSHPLSRAQAAIDLGDFALSVEDEEGARQALDYYRAAIAADPASGRAHAGLGRAQALVKGFDPAAVEANLAKAIELSPRDPVVEVDFGRYAVRRATTASTAAERAHWLDVARTHLLAAWKLDPDNPEAYAFYGASFIMSDEPEKGRATLEHAAELLPSNLDIRIMLARLYLKLTRYDEASRLLTSVLGWLHDSDPAAAKLRSTLQAIERAKQAAGLRHD